MSPFPSNPCFIRGDVLAYYRRFFFTGFFAALAFALAFGFGADFFGFFAAGLAAGVGGGSGILFIIASNRRIISSGGTSSLCVARVHLWPNGSTMVAERSP